MEPKRISLTAMRTLAFGALVWCLAYSASAAAAEVNCRSCHGKLGKEKVQHAALGMGCLTYHAAIDASAMPHKKTNTIARGLTAEQPDLCYGCHDAAVFSRKTVHAAVGMGCTGCHNPHATDGPKLLKSDPPGLCFTCHDKTDFSRKNVHVPVAGGMCMTCHTPHSSDTMALLTKEPVVLCLECHVAVEQKPHVIKGIFNHQRTNGQIGYKMTIHHVYMDDFSTSLDSLVDLISQLGEICREDRRCDADPTFHHHFDLCRCIMPFFPATMTSSAIPRNRPDR